MINGYNQVSATENEIPCFVEDICYGQSLAFNGGVAAFSDICEAATRKCDPAAISATKWFGFRTKTMLLEDPSVVRHMLVFFN